MSRIPKYFVVHFDDGYQCSVIAIDRIVAVHIGNKFEIQYRKIDHNRRIRKAVKASELSDIPAIRSQQFRDIEQNNKAVLNRQRRIARKR